jgi:hypothetical protein
MLTRVVEDLQNPADKFTAQIPILEEKVKHLDNKVVNGLTKCWASELCLEQTTKANDDYRSQNGQLTKMLESKLILSLKPHLVLDI